MARPTGFKEAGGFLNGQDATLLGITFSAKESDKGNWLFATVGVQPDGGEPVELFPMLVGNADLFTIGDNGYTLTPNGEGEAYRLSKQSDFARFVIELLAAGFPQSATELFYSNSSEDVMDFRAVNNWRVHFIQVPDEEATKRLGQRTGTNGKKYDRTRAKVSQVLGVAPQAAKAAAKAAPAPVKGKNGKATDTNLVEAADGVLVAIISDNGGSIQKSRLPVSISRAVDKADPNRRALQDLIYSTDYIDGAVVRGLIAYDAKAQTISLA